MALGLFYAVRHILHSKSRDLLTLSWVFSLSICCSLVAVSASWSTSWAFNRSLACCLALWLCITAFKVSSVQQWTDAIKIRPGKLRLSNFFSRHTGVIQQSLGMLTYRVILCLVLYLQLLSLLLKLKHLTAPFLDENKTTTSHSMDREGHLGRRPRRQGLGGQPSSLHVISQVQVQLCYPVGLLECFNVSQFHVPRLSHSVNGGRDISDSGPWLLYLCVQLTFLAFQGLQLQLQLSNLTAYFIHLWNKHQCLANGNRSSLG